MYSRGPKARRATKTESHSVTNQTADDLQMKEWFYMCMEAPAEGARKLLESILPHCLARHIWIRKAILNQVYQTEAWRKLLSTISRPIFTGVMQHHTDSRSRLPASNAKVTQQPPAGTLEGGSDLQVSKTSV